MAKAPVIILVQGKDEASAVFKQIAGEVARSTEKSKKGLSLLDGVMVGLGQRVVQFASQLPRMTAELVQLGASAQRQARTLDNLAKSAGTSGAAIVSSIQEASGYTIDRMTAMSAASKALIMDVAKGPEQFERLTKVATALGRAMGQDAAKSIDDFVTAGARQSKLIADNLGLVVSATEAQARFAAEMGTTVEQLTDAEKKQAFLNEMLRQGEEKLVALGDTGGDAASQIEILKAAVSDAKTGIGEMAAEALNSSVNIEKLAQVIREFPGWLEAHTKAYGDAEAAWISGESAIAAFDASLAKTEADLKQVDVGLVAQEKTAQAATVAVGDLTVAIGAWEQALAGVIIPSQQAQQQVSAWESMTASATDLMSERAERMKEAGGEIIRGFFGAFGAEHTEQIGLAREELARLAEEAERAASVTGDQFVAAIGPAIDGTDQFSLALFAAADSAGADSAELAALAGMLGIYTEEEIAAALATVAMQAALNELGAAIAEGTVTMADAVTQLQGMIAELPEGISLVKEQTAAFQGAASARQALSDADREAERKERDLKRALAKTGDYLVDALPGMARSTDRWATSLFRAADAAGASAETLALLGGALGMYTEEELQAALATAAMMTRIDELAKAIAGGMGMEQAMGRLQSFQAEMFPVEAYQRGTPFVPRTGLAMLHRGEMVIPSGQAAAMRNTYNLGGNVTNVYDQRAAHVLAAAERRRQREALAGWAG